MRAEEELHEEKKRRGKVEEQKGRKELGQRKERICNKAVRAKDEVKEIEKKGRKREKRK